MLNETINITSAAFNGSVYISKRTMSDMQIISSVCGSYHWLLLVLWGGVLFAIFAKALLHRQIRKYDPKNKNLIRTRELFDDFLDICIAVLAVIQIGVVLNSIW